MNELLLRRRVAAMKESLPSGAVRIEYLESSDTQYIQLPLSVSKSSYFEVGGVIIALHPNNNKYGIFGANPDVQFRVSFYSYTSSNNSNTYGSVVGNIGTNGGWTATIGEKNRFTISTTFVSFSRNETMRELSRPLTANLTGFRIFGIYQNNNRYPVRFCEFYIKVDDAKVYDLIPVRVGTTGYMYDRVSKQLFGNAGSGNFILGQDK